MNESLITEARYDNVIRTLVKDIISLYKFQREGEFSLPEDIRGEENMTYSFPEFKNEFSNNFKLPSFIDNIQLNNLFFQIKSELDELNEISNLIFLGLAKRFFWVLNKTEIPEPPKSISSSSPVFNFDLDRKPKTEAE